MESVKNLNEFFKQNEETSDDVNSATNWEKIYSAPKNGEVIIGFHIIHKVPIAIYYTGSAWREKTLTTEWPEESFSHWSKMTKSPEL